MTQENLKRLLKHYQETGNVKAAEDILKKYQITEEEEKPVKAEKVKKSN